MQEELRASATAQTPADELTKAALKKTKEELVSQAEKFVLLVVVPLEDAQHAGWLQVGCEVILEAELIKGQGGRR